MIARDNDTLRVSAPMLIGNAADLLAAGRDSLRSVPPSERVLIDLGQVQEVDSSALSVVFAWLRTAARQGVGVRLVNPPASMLSLAEFYGVSELLPLA